MDDDSLSPKSIAEAVTLAGAMNYDLGAAITEKLAFNATRPDHKPEARAAENGKAY